MGSTLAIGLAVSVTGAVLTLWFHAPLPYLVGLLFVAIVLIMAYELSGDLQRSAQLSRELHESRERMSLAVAAADIAMWEWDIVKDEFWTSDNCRTRLVMPNSERLDSKRFLQLLHPEDREHVTQALAASINGDGNYSGEHRVLLPNGEVKWIAATGRTEYDASHKPVRVRGMSMEVTRLKEAELKIRHQRKELARLSRAALLGELSASLAHELNQPLGAILANAQTAQLHLSRDPADLHQMQEILSDIVTADERAVEIMRRLRLLFQQGKVRMQQLDLNELIREVLKMVRSDIANRQVSVNTELADLPASHGDRVQLQQVLLNLIFNACDAMTGINPESRKLVVRTRVSPDEGICVTIADRGCGIPPENLARIFDPFYTSKPNSMGFGLSVCRSIISAHRGKVWAENNTDGGASFHFMLPGMAVKKPVGELASDSGKAGATAS
jgi:C4-dicarboxylate-specific signal transduction histidine kinase